MKMNKKDKPEVKIYNFFSHDKTRAHLFTETTFFADTVNWHRDVPLPISLRQNYIDCLRHVRCHCLNCSVMNEAVMIVLELELGQLEVVTLDHKFSL